MKYGWVAVVVVLLQSGGCKKKDIDWSRFEKQYTDNAPALKAMCTPAIDLGVHTPPPLTADAVTDVAPLTEANAAVLSETMAGVLASREEGGKVQDAGFLGGELWHNSQPFVDLCSWATAGKAFRSSTPEGFLPTVSTEDAVHAKIDAAIQHALAVRYIVVIHAVAYTAPIVDHGYTPGTVTAEARIIDSKGAAHGGFRFTATSSTHVDIQQTVDGKGHVQGDNSSTSVEGDLAQNAAHAFAKALVTAVPGSTLKLPVS